MSFRWEVPPDLAFPQLVDRYSRVILQSGRRIAYERAEDMENFAKQNAPWQDVTGNARERLHATVEENGPLAEIILAHGVDYGVWLELSHGGKNQILATTLDIYGPIVMRDLQRIMNLQMATRG